jgi:hypothetical protein
MTDFVEQTVTKTAVRKLATPIGSSADFDALVNSVVNTNPWGCTPYEVSGVAQPAVSKSRETYTARVIYEDVDGKTLGNATAKAGSIAGFNAVNTELLANTALTTAIGGTAVRDTEGESYSCTLKCHHANGELYNVTFTRENVRISSYTDDAIKTAVDTWADGIPDLA